MSWVETTEDPRAGADASRVLADSLPDASRGQLGFAFRPQDLPEGEPAHLGEGLAGGEFEGGPGATTMSVGLEEWLEERVSLVDDGGLRAMGVAAQAHGYLWVPLEPPGPQFRGRLGLYIEESVESELERLGALSPGIHASTGLDASLSDQLYRARLVEKRGIALTLPSLEGICNLGRILDADDGAVLRWWIAATGERPVRVVVSRKNSSLRVYPSPVLFESLFDVAPFPLSPRPPCALMAESRDAMELSDLPSEVAGSGQGNQLSCDESSGEATDVLGTTLGPVDDGDSLFAELWGGADVELPELDDALGLSAGSAHAVSTEWETEELEVPATAGSDEDWSRSREAPTMVPQAWDAAQSSAGAAQAANALSSVDAASPEMTSVAAEDAIIAPPPQSEDATTPPSVAGGTEADAPPIPDLELARSVGPRATSEELPFDLPDVVLPLESETPLMPLPSAGGPSEAEAPSRLRQAQVAEPSPVVSSPLRVSPDHVFGDNGAGAAGFGADDPEEMRPTRPGGVVGLALAAALSARAEEVRPAVAASLEPEHFAGLDPDEFLRTLAEDSARTPEVEAVVSPADAEPSAASAVLGAEVREGGAAQAKLAASARTRDVAPVRASPSLEPLPTKKIRPFLRMATEEEAAQLSPQARAENSSHAPAPLAEPREATDEDEQPSGSVSDLDASTADPADPFNQLASREWRKWVKNLEQARGPKPLAVVERMFVTDYTRLREAVRRNIADASAGAVLEEWRESFARSYTEAFEALRMRGKRPTMVVDLPEVAQRLARLQGARRLQLLLVDGMRFDLGLMIQERMKTRVDAALTERLLMWSALPTTTTTQLELLGRGPEGLKEPLPREEDEPPALVARGRGAATARRIRTGRLELYKIDVIEDELRQVGAPVLSRFGQIADVAADAICSHLEKQPPRTLVVVFGDHGFAIDPTREKTTAEVHQGGASPEEVLVPAFAWLTGAVH